MNRSYSNRPPLQDVSLDFYPGELSVIIGHGNAGKTDLLNMILGLTRPETGEVNVFGHDPGSNEALNQIGVVLDSIDFPFSSRLAEIIELVSAHYADPVPAGDLVQRCGLEDMVDAKVSELNNAQQRWLAVLLSMVNNPSALVMDLPMLGMDVGWRRDLWKLLAGYADEGGLVLITSDVLHEVEVFANRVVIMHGGRVVVSGSVSGILSEHGQRTVSMRADSLPDLDGEADVEWLDDGPRLRTTDSDSVVHALEDHGVAFEELEVRRPSLEDVVLSLIEAEDIRQ